MITALDMDCAVYDVSIKSLAIIGRGQLVATYDLAGRCRRLANLQIWIRSVV